MVQQPGHLLLQLQSLQSEPGPRDRHTKCWGSLVGQSISGTKRIADILGQEPFTDEKVETDEGGGRKRIEARKDQDISGLATNGLREGDFPGRPIVG